MMLHHIEPGLAEPPLNQRVKLFKELSRLRVFDTSTTNERAALSPERSHEAHHRILENPGLTRERTHP